VAKIELKIVGHELVTTQVKTAKRGVYETRDRLKVKFRGLGGDARTVLTLMTDPGQQDEFPLGQLAEISVRIPQTSMDLGERKGNSRGKSASPAAGH